MTHFPSLLGTCKGSRFGREASQQAFEVVDVVVTFGHDYLMLVMGGVAVPPG